MKSKKERVLPARLSLTFYNPPLKKASARIRRFSGPIGTDEKEEYLFLPPKKSITQTAKLI
jgi:hypothetical protein